MIVVDGAGVQLGRLASFVAKQALLGKTVHVINAEKVIISGNKEDIYRRWKQRIDLTNKGTPFKAPQYPRTPHGIVKRAIRGMLPRKRRRGKAALRRIKVHIGVPEELKNIQLIKLEVKEPLKYITVGELARMLGWKG